MPRHPFFYAFQLLVDFELKLVKTVVLEFRVLY